MITQNNSNTATDEQMISSKSPTIDITMQRKILEISKEMNKFLTEEEAKIILSTYGMAIERILKENNLE